MNYHHSQSWLTALYEVFDHSFQKVMNLGFWLYNSLFTVWRIYIHSLRFNVKDSLNRILHLNWLLTFSKNFGTLLVFVIKRTVFKIGPWTSLLITSSLKTCLLHGLGYLLNTELQTWSHPNLKKERQFCNYKFLNKKKLYA